MAFNSAESAELYTRGTTCYDKGDFSEAQTLFQQAIDIEEIVWGVNHNITLHYRAALGYSVLRQDKYVEAEELLRPVAESYNKVYGPENVYTLRVKRDLGNAMLGQEKFKEAEMVLREAFETMVIALGKDHLDTIRAKLALGQALVGLERYDESEDMISEVVEVRSKVLGQEDEATLESKYALGWALYRSRRCNEAEEILRKLARARSKVLGTEHKLTLDTRGLLGCTLVVLQRYSEAESLLRQVADIQKKTLGRNHGSTVATVATIEKMRQLQESDRKASENNWESDDHRRMFKLHFPRVENPHKRPTRRKRELRHERTTSNERELPQSSDHRLSSYFPLERKRSAPYTEADIDTITELLRYIHPRWSRYPRTYIVLRALDQLDCLDDLIEVGFSDHWFPVTERSLPDFLSPGVRSKIAETQHIVLTKSISLEKGNKGQHCYFKPDEPIPFDSLLVLGTGGFGQVDKVMSTISFKEYARKRVLKSATFRGPKKEHMKQFITEIQILKRLRHQHVVELIGSYTDRKYIGLIMLPVAEKDLGAYLRTATVAHRPELRTFFGCLATALEYLHSNEVRHKDIKPGNILVNRGNILFTDFGLSYDFEDASGSTTVSMVNGMTAKYCAPEIAHHEPRNTTSDIWSLGVVFMEMVTVLKGKSVQDMYDYLAQHGSRQGIIRTNLIALEKFAQELSQEGSLSDNKTLDWAKRMLSLDQQTRPTAASLASSITASSEENGSRFCGICCLPDEEEDFSDCESPTTGLTSQVRSDGAIAGEIYPVSELTEHVESGEHYYGQEVSALSALSINREV